MDNGRHNMMDYDRLCKDFKIEVPEYYNFAYDVVDKWAELDRNKLAMIWTNQQGEERKFTFRDLRNLSNHAANVLLKHGIGKGDYVLIMLPRLPEWWIFSLAMIKLGVVQCTAPGLLTPQDIEYRMNAGKFKMVITDTANAPKFDAVFDLCPALNRRMLVDGERPGWISYQQECALQSPLSHREVNNPFKEKTRSDDPMFIFFTSGTNRHPKMVLHDYSYPLGHRITGKYWHDLRSTDLHFTISDTGWGKCAWGKYFGQWQEGACVFVYDIRGKFNAEEILPLLEKYEITSFCAPPTIYRMLVLADLAKFDFRELRHCCSAGEPLHTETSRLWREGTGLDIHEGYGQTETVCVIAMFPGLEKRAGAMGKAAPGWEIELHDSSGRPVGVGEIGRIAIKTSPRPVGLFRKYIGNPKDQEDVFRDGFYYTGDKAIIDNDGYFYFCGRNDDIIKSSGYRIGPSEVEFVLMGHPAVLEAAVVGAPDPIRGEKVKAYIVLNEGYTAKESLVKEIQSHVKRNTAPYKYPREIEFMDRLPKTHSGKIRRSLLREHAATGGIFEEN